MKMLTKISRIAKNIYFELYSFSRNLLLIKNRKTDQRRRLDSSFLNCVVSYNKYGGYCIPKSSCHRPAARAVLKKRIWEPNTIQYVIDNCGEGDVIHAGTFFGDFLPAFSQAIDSRATVWAFEPNIESFRCAEITINLNDIQNVELRNTGLGEKADFLRLATKDVNGVSLGGSSRILNHQPTNASGTEVVQIVTIDDTVEQNRHVSIIQLDVEGYEKQALAGAIQTINRCRPIIILEILPDSNLLDSDWFKDNILALGYRKTGEVHNNSIFRCNT
jgi:FkbM family methyltransferase